jgi:CTP-dependent riboflavin kinase
MEHQKISGTLATGLGQATGFTSLDWARDAFRNHLGIDPFPGTVNMILTDEDDRAAWLYVKTWSGIIIPPPRPDWCSSRCYRARINEQIEAAIVLPEIDGYPEHQIELIAAIPVRETLSLTDGDPLAIDVQAL